MSNNPFRPGDPITDPALFFGREDVFVFIRQQLATGKRPQAAALIGERGIGKTSALLQTPYQIESRYLPVYLNLNEVDYGLGAAGFFDALVARTVLAIESLGEFQFTAFVETGKWLSDAVIEGVFAVLPRFRRVTFLLDDAGALLNAIEKGQLPRDFGHALSTWFARDERVTAVFALDSADEPRLATFEPLTDPLQLKRLGFLGQDAAIRLCQDAAAPNYRVDDEALEAILALTGRHPYLLHVVNARLWELSARRNHQADIALDDVNAVIGEALDGAEAMLARAWDNSTAQEQLALMAVTALSQATYNAPVSAAAVYSWLIRQMDAPVDETTVGAALRRLEYRDILRASEGGTYLLSSGLQQQWLIPKLGTHGLAARRASPNVALSARRLIAFAVVLLMVATGSTLLFSRGGVETAGSTLAPTFTLALDIRATRNSIAATQTFDARPTSTPTATFTFTPTATPTPSATATATSTATSTPTATFTPTATATESSTPTVSATPTSTRTASLTASPTYSATATPTPSATLTGTASPTETLTATPSPSATSTPTGTLTPSATSAPSVTPPAFPTGQLRAPTNTPRPTQTPPS